MFKKMRRQDKVLLVSFVVVVFFGWVLVPVSQIVSGDYAQGLMSLGIGAGFVMIIVLAWKILMFRNRPTEHWTKEFGKATHINAWKRREWVAAFRGDKKRLEAFIIQRMRLRYGEVKYLREQTGHMGEIVEVTGYAVKRVTRSRAIITLLVLSGMHRNFINATQEHDIRLVFDYLEAGVPAHLIAIALDNGIDPQLALDLDGPNIHGLSLRQLSRVQNNPT